LDTFGRLPMVVGDDAPAHAESLLLLLATEPELMARVAAAVRIGQRRWTLHLDNGVDVALPEEDAASAWARLAALERSDRVLERDVAALDLRQPDRLIARLGTEAAARLAAPPAAPAKPGAVARGKSPTERLGRKPNGDPQPERAAARPAPRLAEEASQRGP